MKLPDIEVCKTWVQDNKPNYSQYARPTPVPKFCLVTSKVKWGDGPSRAETKVLKILCAKKMEST
eukprot:2634775-Ditylum_brightwellii.AAC.1